MSYRNDSHAKSGCHFAYGLKHATNCRIDMGINFRAEIAANWIDDDQAYVAYLCDLRF